ncbi:hypothetical protein I302_102973 [Kwoniella bestiolae CBS 10118]|uniref:Zn(2)-C6 fungal-type domain-containing protein n=1 Tax=Kwoniella bestiolae CBS 10118 TaxID=1296100 RepID=A0A1B9GGI7_9TREE|nr:hypothetical protein I302_01669 [Kwoniella bestiolae CBS 10118]OCF30150.1 hypothetical protein I302_01669 [Kwoniella bestiolae CBS 10118]
MSSPRTAHIVDLAFRPLPPPDDDTQFINPSLLMNSSTNEDAFAQMSHFEPLPTETTADAEHMVPQVDKRLEQTGLGSSASVTQPAKIRPVSLSPRVRRLLSKTESAINTSIDGINNIMENDRYSPEEITDFPTLQGTAFESYRHHSTFTNRLINPARPGSSDLNTELRDLQDTLISLVGLSNDITRQLRANAPSITGHWWKCDGLHKISKEAISAFRSSKYLAKELGLVGKSCVTCQNHRIACEPYEKSAIVVCANCKAKQIGCTFNSEAGTQVKVRDASW